MKRGKKQKIEVMGGFKWHGKARKDHVFFFKQKTAYEMCGRDWSSDVCSSDLILDPVPTAGDLC